MPLYLFLGGAAGTLSVLGAVADLSGRPALTRVARVTSGGGRWRRSSSWFTIWAGLNGSYTCCGCSSRRRRCRWARTSCRRSPAASAATAAVELLGWFPRLNRFGGLVAALFGGPLATYTAVLLSNTAVPSWHDFHTKLPFVFAGSAMAAGGGLCMVFTPVDEAGPARKMAVTGAAIELAVVHQIENDKSIVSEPYHLDRAGTFMQAAKACTAAGAGLTVVAGRTRLGSVASGTPLAAGSLLTRFGVFDAGMASARDPIHGGARASGWPPGERRVATQDGHVSTVTR